MRQPGGVAILAEKTLDHAASGRWHRLELSFAGSTITGTIDGKPALSVQDATYGAGMAGLLAGAGADRWSRPFYDNLSLSAGADSAEGIDRKLVILPLYPPAR